MLFIPIIVSIFSLFFVYFLIREINKASSGSGPMIEISQAIKKGALDFLKRQYKTCGLVAIVIFFLFLIFLGIKMAIGFLIGAMASGLAGFLNMIISTKANNKKAEDAMAGLKPALSLFSSVGPVTGFLVVGLALLTVSGFYLLMPDFQALIALCFGASLIAIFARLGGGIYFKAADVGDCAGMAGDMFQTYVVALVASMFLGNLVFSNNSPAIFLPLILLSLAVLASIISTFFVGLLARRLVRQSFSVGGSRPLRRSSYGGRVGEGGGKDQNILSAFYKGLIGAGVLSALGFLLVIFQFSQSLKISPFSLYLPALIGLLIAGGIFIGKKFTILPVILISLGILISFALGGMYALAISAVAMISLTGLIPAPYRACSPERSEGEEEAKPLRPGAGIALDSKGYAIASAGFVSLILFFVYTQELLSLGKRVQFFLEDPKVLVGLFAGGIVVYYFAALVNNKEMLLPGLLPVFAPILVGFLLGPEALGGLLIGSIIVGIFLSIQMIDTIGPAISPMIKTLSIVALLIKGFLV